ncbi:MAG TPA: Hsp70 family protein, partial [bacterium]|nr:Hsp70 family protein [bacterium]
TAKDKATGKEQKIRIEASSGLSKDDIDKLVKDAKSHESEDKKRREEIDLRNQADALAYNTEKFLKDNKEKIPSDMAGQVGEACEALKKAVNDKDSAAMKSKMEALTALSHKMAEAMYKATSEAPGAGSEAKAGGEEPKKEEKKDEKVVDAEFEENK